MDLASLSISVTSNGVQTAARNLESLGKAAANADAPIRNVASSLSYMKNQDVSSFVTTVKSLNDTLRAGKGGFSDFVTSASSLTRVSTSFTAVANASEKLTSNVAGLSAVADQLARIQSSLEAMKGSASVVNRISGGGTARSSSSSGGGGSGSTMGTSAASEVGAYTQKQNILLSQLEREAYLVNHTKAEWLEYRAAKLGVTAAATPYISTMKQATSQTQQFGMSTKATAAAMRMVPAQFTDIVTQLAGGQNPLLIMIQQGGQLRDMFQGFGPMFQAVGGIILKFVLNPFVLATAAIVAFGYALNTALSEGQAFTDSLIKTGGYAGYTARSLEEMSVSMTKGVSTTGQLKDALMAVVSSGKFTGDTVGLVAKGVADLAKVTGDKIPNVVKDFVALSKEPAKEALKLNEEFHFLTVSTYQQISAMEQLGNKQGAAKLAMETLAAAAAKMRKEQIDNMDILTMSATGWALVYDRLSTKLKEFLGLTAASRLQAKRDELSNLRDVEKRLGDRLASKDRDRMEFLEFEISTEEAKANFAQRTAAWNAKVLQQQQSMSQYVADVQTRLGGTQTREQFIASVIKKQNEYRASGAQQLQGGLTDAQLRLDLEKQLEAFDSKRQTKAGKLAETEAQRLGKLNQKYSEQALSLEDITRSFNEQTESLFIQGDVVDKTNSHLQAALELYKKADSAQSTKEASILREAAAREQIAGIAQQNFDKEKQYQENIGQIEGEIAANRKTYHAQRVADLKMLRDINPLFAINEEESKQLATADKYKAELEAYGMYENAKLLITQQADQKRLAAAEQMYVQMGMYNKVLMSSVNAIGSSMTANLVGLINKTSTLSDVMKSLGNTILTSVIGAIVQWGLEEVKRMVLAQTMQAASMAATIVEASATAAAWAPAAMAASIATLGSAAGIGATAYGAAMAAARVSSLPMMDNGGVIPAGGAAIVGERGAEIITGPAHVTSRQETAKMLGGNSAPIINIQTNTSAPLQTSSTTNDKGEILIMIQEMLPDMLAAENGNPKSKSNKALSSVYRMQRA